MLKDMYYFDFDNIYARPEIILPPGWLSRESKNMDSAAIWGIYEPSSAVTTGEIIFPRIDLEKEMKALSALTSNDNKTEAPAPEKKSTEEKPEGVALIGIDDFAKVDLRVAKVISCEKVEKSDKLLKLVLSCGNEEKQVVSGIAKYYSPEEMVGKTLILVANLKPAKLRGIESQGMILAASDGEKLVLVTVDKDIPSGSKVS